MTSRPYARAALLSATLLSLALPTAAVASSGSGSGSGTSGGAGLNPTTTTSASAAPTTSVATGPATSGQPAAAAVTPAGGPVSTQGNGFTLSSSSVGTVRRALSFSGSVSGSNHGDLVAIQRQTPAGGWSTIAQATVAQNGSFDATWHPSASGLVGFRAVLGGPAGTAQVASAAAASASPILAVTIYRDAVATIYGPGFYGHKTACGFKLTTATLGVASRTLKCGTPVSIDYGGHTITVPVIDRGPYANGANWDLTEATAQALGDTDTETIGAAVL